MKWYPKRSILVEVISSLFILLFIYTAVSKYFDIGRFKWALSESQLIPNSLSALIAYSIPAIEILVSLMLFLPKYRLAGLYSSLVLMTLFTLYIGILVTFYKNELPCSCGGIISKIRWSEHLVLNIVLTLLALAGIYLSRKSANTNSVNTYRAQMQ